MEVAPADGDAFPEHHDGARIKAKIIPFQDGLEKTWNAVSAFA